MLRVAFLGEQFVGQLSQRKLEEIDPVWVGVSPERFRVEVPALTPDVVVLDLAELKDVSNEEVASLVERCRAELAILTYSFARRQLIRSLQGPKVRALQAPITLETLQAHFAPLVIRRVLESTRKEVFPMQPPTPPAPKYSRAQLGKLMEVTSTIKCECPNHLAQLVERLQAFETYSKDCENLTPDDAQMHGLLYRATASARIEMERALDELLAYEKLTVE